MSAARIVCLGYDGELSMNRRGVLSTPKIAEGHKFPVGQPGLSRNADEHER
jgi:hypothetical protein